MPATRGSTRQSRWPRSLHRRAWQERISRTTSSCKATRALGSWCTQAARWSRMPCRYLPQGDLAGATGERRCWVDSGPSPQRPPRARERRKRLFRPAPFAAHRHRPRVIGSRDLQRMCQLGSGEGYQMPAGRDLSIGVRTKSLRARPSRTRDQGRGREAVLELPHGSRLHLLDQPPAVDPDERIVRVGVRGDLVGEI
jgi:hypothetical protein